MQNDILKEYIARGNYIFPPRPSMRLTTDLFAYCAERIPSWNTISISGYHIREAGSTAVQELAFTLANGIAYCGAAVEAGLSPDEFGERLSFFFNAHNDFFQEVAKFRAARRLWARIMRERFGATNPKALALRFHAQTGGSTLTAQQPENNIVRVAIQALSAVCGGAQSLHTNSFDEALALPTEHAATIALRTQQILAHEAGTTATADPLGGSYYVEALTDELEARAWELIERIDELGGAVAAIEQGFVQGEIEDGGVPLAAGGRVGRARDRRRQRVRRRGGASRSSCSDRPGDRAAPARAHGARARRARRRRRRRRARRGARGRAGRRRTCSSRCARRCARAARSARSAACSARSGASTTASAPPTLTRRCGSCSSPRCTRGPTTRTSARSSRRASARCATAGTTSSSPCSTGAPAGKRAVPRAAPQRPPRARARTSCGRTSSCRPGSSRLEVDAPLVVTAHGRDVRNIGALPGRRAADAPRRRHARRP